MPWRGLGGPSARLLCTELLCPAVLGQGLCLGLPGPSGTGAWTGTNWTTAGAPSTLPMSP